MRTGGVRYGIELDTLSCILHYIVGKVRHKTNACGLETSRSSKKGGGERKRGDYKGGCP